MVKKLLLKTPVNEPSSNEGLVGKLRQAMQTAEERGKVYGASHRNYEQNARIVSEMFPDGVTLKGTKDFARFIILIMTTVKLSRYVNNWVKGGHQDSIHDMGVYSFILEDFDERCANGEFNSDNGG